MGLLKRQLIGKVSTAAAAALLVFYLSLVAIAPSGSAAEAESGPPSPNNHQFFLGTCLLTLDPQIASDDSPQRTACIKASAGAESSVDSDHGKNSLGYFSHAYAGLHYSDELSVHFAGNTGSTYSTVRKEPLKKPRANLEELSVRFGNRAIHSYTAALGLLNLPFGINLYPRGDLRGRDKFADFWTTEQLGGYATWQESFPLRVDAGFSTVLANLGDPESMGHFGSSVRVTRAISALDGTQFSASAYGRKNGLRRAGVALLNSSRRGELTGIEWVREMKLRSDEPIKQIIRVSYQGAMTKKGQWAATYDHVNHVERSGQLSNIIDLMQYTSAILGLRYTASSIDEVPSSWTFTTGVAARL
jgi:hypothetical protein